MLTDISRQEKLRMQAKISGKGSPIVLVPGGLTGWLSWERHAELLSRERKAVRVQLVSVEYGLEHRALPQDYSLRTESSALKNTLDYLGLTAPLDLAGWSFGAAVALDFALDNPGRIRTLTLIEPPALWVLGGEEDQGAGYRALKALSDSIEGDISEDQLRQFACAVGLCPPGLPPEKLPQWPSWLQHRRSLLNTPAVFRHTDDLSRLPEFHRPVLLVKGRGSAGFLHRIIDLLAERLPEVWVTELPSGHAPHLVSPESFLEEMSVFQHTQGAVSV